MQKSIASWYFVIKEQTHFQMVVSVFVAAIIIIIHGKIQSYKC